MDPGEFVSVTLKREFGEEALNSQELSDEEKHKMEETISELFHNGTEVSCEVVIHYHASSFSYTGICRLCG